MFCLCYVMQFPFPFMNITFVRAFVRLNIQRSLVLVRFVCITVYAFVFPIAFPSARNVGEMYCDLSNFKFFFCERLCFILFALTFFWFAFIHS